MSVGIKIPFPTRCRPFLLLLLFAVVVLGTLTIVTDSVALSSCCCPEGYIRGKDGKGCHYIKPMKWRNPSLQLCFLIGTIMVLAPAFTIAWVYSNNNRKVDIRAQFFDDNGGNLLLKEVRKRRRSSSHSTQIKIYSAEVIKRATSNYSDSLKIMQASCKGGTAIYLGTISHADENDTTEVLIMKIEKIPRDKIKHFVKQLVFVSQPHTNLIRLVGCCLETQSPILVYENHGDGTCTLLDKKLDRDFSYYMRLKAAADSARALNHLHSNKMSSAKARVHGNVSSCNVVLDGNYTAKIFYAFDWYSCDFAGNRPSGHSTAPINDDTWQGDVHGFGTVLKDVLATAFDRYPATEREVDRLAERCLSQNRKGRPKMADVEKLLSKMMNSLGLGGSGNKM